MGTIGLRNKLRDTRGGAAAKVLVVVLVLVIAGFAAWRFGLLDGALEFFGIGGAPPAEPLMASPAEQAEALGDQTEGDGAAETAADETSGSSGGGSWFGTPLYAYAQLDKEDQEIYDIILAAYRSRTEQPLPDGLTNDDISRVNEHVMADHPELFYIDSCNIMTVTTTDIFGESEKKSVQGVYLYGEEETAELQAQLDEAASVWLAELPEGADDYAKAKYVYERLIRTVDYDVSAREDIGSSDQTLLSALLYGNAVCAGYSKAFEYLMQAMGIECVNVVGTGYGEAHSWNVALLDGAYYHIDPTWGDPLYTGEDDGASDDVNFDYLGLTTADIGKTHEPDSAFSLPECTSRADNYYVREGLFLESADIDAVAAIIDNASWSGENHVRFRCSDGWVEETLRRLLIDDGAVYSLTGANTIRYNTPNELNTIALWW